MGTTKEWGEVLFAAILWGGGMLLFRRMEGKIPKDAVLIYALGALLFGLVASFPLKRVFSFPLMLLPLGIIVVLLIWIRKTEVKKKISPVAASFLASQPV